MLLPDDEDPLPDDAVPEEELVMPLLDPLEPLDPFDPLDPLDPPLDPPDPPVEPDPPLDADTPDPPFEDVAPDPLPLPEPEPLGEFPLLSTPLFPLLQDPARSTTEVKDAKATVDVHFMRFSYIRRCAKTNGKLAKRALKIVAAPSVRSWDKRIAS